MEALFTSLIGGDGLRQRILDLIAEAVTLSYTRKVDLHIMMFAFTDKEIADALSNAAAQHQRLTIRILVDWSQRTRSRGVQIVPLIKFELPNLRVRYKNDQPYMWDSAAGHVRWSYHASRGLLHHKALIVLVDGRPWKMICGSFNWTGNAALSYENLLVVTSSHLDAQYLMSRFELEFEAMWSDGHATLSPEEADLHYHAIVDSYRCDPTISPSDVVGIIRGEGEPLQTLDSLYLPSEREGPNNDNYEEQPGSEHPRISVAFSSRLPIESSGQRGYAKPNRIQRFLLHKPSAKSKRVPLTLTTLALDTIFQVESGDILKVAMYGLSTRVPEYGALLDAARRGVRLFILLDGSVGVNVARRLAIVRYVEHLPIEIRIGCKTMHQKYIIHPNSATVLTGTANMTTDASDRHSEHRIQVRGCQALMQQFCADFDLIWNRLSSDTDRMRQFSLKLLKEKNRGRERY